MATAINIDAISHQVFKIKELYTIVFSYSSGNTILFDIKQLDHCLYSPWITVILGKCDIFGTDIDEFPKMGFSAYDVKSLTYCELQCVALDPPFHQLLEQYPVFQKEFAAALHTELSFNIREGYEAVSPSEVLPAITLKANGAEQQDHKSVESTQSTEIFQRPISRKGAEGVRHFANMRADSVYSSGNSSNQSLTSKGLRDSTSETYLQRLSTCKGSQDQNPPTCRRTSGTSVCVDPFYYNPHLYETLDFIDDTTRPPVLPTTGSSWDASQTFGINGPNNMRKTYSNNAKPTELITTSCPNLYEICETNTSVPSSRLQSLNEVSPINVRRNETKRQLSPWRVSRTRCRWPSTKITVQENGFLPDDVTSFTNFLWHIQRELRLLQLEVRHLSHNLTKCQTDLGHTHKNKNDKSTTVEFPTEPNYNNSSTRSEISSHQTHSLPSVKCSTYTELYKPAHNYVTSPVGFAEKVSSPKGPNEHRVVKFSLPPQKPTLKRQFGSEMGVSTNKSIKSYARRRNVTQVSTESGLTSPQAEIKHADTNSCFCFPQMEDV